MPRQNRKNDIQSHPSTKTITKSKKSQSKTVILNNAEGTVEGRGSGREKLKRHRVEVAGRVWIPDIWGQEDLLKDWIDCSVFDSPVIGSSVVSARASLIEEGRNVNSAAVFARKNGC